MSYRGDGEPEYIDDEEYFDPDDGASRQDSNVLGGSGSKYSRDNLDEAPADPPSASGRGRRQRDRPAAAKSAARGAARSRNPAPSVANSEERRARLAGKKSIKKSRPATSKRDKAEPGPVDSGDKGRFGRLRARFSRQAKPETKTTKPSELSKSNRAAGIKGGVRGRIRSIRSRFPSKGSADGKAQDRSHKTGQGAGKSKFGLSSGGARPADATSTAAYAAGRVRDKVTAEDSARQNKTPKIESTDWLDLDRKLDLIGVALVFGAIVLMFSALSAEQAAIGAVHHIIGQVLGWGAFAVPVTMFAIGMWLIIRHFGDEPPTIDPLRIAGVGLAFLAALVSFQYLDSLTYGEAMANFSQCGNPASRGCVNALVQHSYQSVRGGGLIGGWIYSALVNNLTEIGGFVIVVMVLTFGAMMITRLSMAELALVTVGVGRNLRTTMAQVAARRRVARLEAQRQLSPAQQSADIRVSKPATVRLSAAGQAGALPEPSADSMPIPDRLRTLFSLPRKLAGRAEESVPLAEKLADANGTNHGGRFTHFVPNYLKRGDRFRDQQEAVEPQLEPAPNAGYLERFLNLGDDLPASSAIDAMLPPPADASDKEMGDPTPRSRSGSDSATAISDELGADAGVAPAPFSLPADQNGDKIDATADEQTLEKPAKPLDMPAPAPPEELPPEPFDAASDVSLASVASEPAETAAAAQPEDVSETDAEDEALVAETAKTEPDAAKEPVAEAPSRPRTVWDLPEFRGLLTSGSASELDQEPLIRQAQIIEETLASFGAPGRVVEINSGPVITQYGVEPGYLTSSTGKRNRVKVGAIAKLDKDLQLALGARSVRMEAPVPGKGYVGIEVPNPDTARVSLRDVMESASYQEIDSPLAIALGMSVDGTPISADLTQMPHMLIAGTTGSGKSVCVNAIINSILATNSPETVKFIMVDPKRVELTGYNGLPHLVAPVVVELERIVGVLRWVTTEMDERYKKFSRCGARNIVDYNSILDPDLAPMPYIVVIIDELADLMMMAPDDTERAIARIAALARATGIHLVIATQRPSVDVVTGLIKANCPARIAFAVAGSIDSRVILDQPGAERLLGKGDMLYMSGDSPAPLRMQGVHVSNEEIDNISRFWKLQGAGLEGVKPIPLPPVSSSPGRDGPAQRGKNGAPHPAGGGQAAFWDMSSQRDMTGMAVEKATGNPNPAEDELYQTAVDMVRRLEKASISLLQRRLRIGYTRAARLVDMMEERGVVGPPKEGSSKPRDVLPE